MDVVITVGIAIVNILLTVNIFILQTIGKRLDMHEEILKEYNDILRKLENRIIILETKFNACNEENK